MVRVPPELFALAGLFAVNRLVLPRFVLVPAVFWLINLLDLAAALAIYAFGMPGLESQIAVRVLVGTLLLFHIGQNFAVRARKRDQQDEPARRLARLQALKVTTQADQDDDEPSGPRGTLG